MRVVIQRVLEAQVKVDDVVVGAIGKGLLVFLGVGTGDTQEITKKYMDKLMKLRIFQDEQGKTNKALADVSGEILLISQFTLHASCKKGNRPDFIQAAGAELANNLYEYALKCIRDSVGKVEAGLFGADMKVSLVNDGPFTIILDEFL